MVFTGSGEEESMAMGTEKSKPLHNFMLPSLKWGSQRHLRCMKVPTDAAGDQQSLPPVTVNRELESSLNNARGSDKKQTKITKPPIHADDGIDAVREKLMLDLKTESERIKDVILGKEVAEEKANNDEEVVAAAMMAVAGAGTGTGEGSSAAPAGERPWNLRKRNKGIVIGESGKGLLKIDEKKPNSSPSKKPEKTEKVKFSLSLTKEEIEEDFMLMLGHKPPRRPKRRPRNVQKLLDTTFPGMWLSEVTPDSYKVPDAPDNGGKDRKKK